MSAPAGRLDRRAGGCKCEVVAHLIGGHHVNFPSKNARYAPEVLTLLLIPLCRKSSALVAVGADGAGRCRFHPEASEGGENSVRTRPLHKALKRRRKSFALVSVGRLGGPKCVHVAFGGRERH